MKTLVWVIVAAILVTIILLCSEYIGKEYTRPSGSSFSQSEEEEAIKKEAMRSKYIDENLKFKESKDLYISGIPVKRMIFHDEHGKAVVIAETHDGEIISYSSTSKYGKHGTKNITKEEALKIVKEELEVPEDYVLSEIEDNGNRYHFWFHRVVDGVSLRCDWISALVNKGTGEISMWTKTYHEELPNLNPTLSEEEALRIANEEFNGGAEIKDFTVTGCWKPGEEPTWNTPAPIKRDSKLCLVWLIVDTDSEYYRYMSLDAHTGKRI